MSGWTVIDGPRAGFPWAKAAHVVPCGDLREHDLSEAQFLDGRPCWCAPDRRYKGDGLILTHHAADARELVEQHGVN